MLSQITTMLHTFIRSPPAGICAELASAAQKRSDNHKCRSAFEGGREARGGKRQKKLRPARKPASPFLATRLQLRSPRTSVAVVVNVPRLEPVRGRVALK